MEFTTQVNKEIVLSIHGDNEIIEYNDNSTLMKSSQTQISLCQQQTFFQRLGHLFLNFFKKF